MFFVEITSLLQKTFQSLGLKLDERQELQLVFFFFRKKMWFSSHTTMPNKNSDVSISANSFNREQIRSSLRKKM